MNLNQNTLNPCTNVMHLVCRNITCDYDSMHHVIIMILHSVYIIALLFVDCITDILFQTIEFNFHIIVL